MKGDCDPEMLVAVITTVGIPVEGDFSDIGMNSINVVIHMDCDVKAPI